MFHPEEIAGGRYPKISSSIYFPLIYMTLGLNFSKLHFPFLQNGDWDTGLPIGRKLTLGPPPRPCPSYIHMSKPTLGAKWTRWPARQIPVLLIPKYLEAASHIRHKSDKTGQPFLLKGKASLTAKAARDIHSQTAVHVAAVCTWLHFTLLSAPDHKDRARVVPSQKAHERKFCYFYSSSFRIGRTVFLASSD